MGLVEPHHVGEGVVEGLGTVGEGVVELTVVVPALLYLLNRGHSRMRAEGVVPKRGKQPDHPKYIYLCIS